MINLLSKKCVPCEGGVLPMSQKEAQKYLADVKGWELVGGEKIERDFKFKDFKEAMVFVNRVADLAEREGHHPDIAVHGWNNVRLELSTHSIGGLSENDFILAAKINDIP